MTEDLNSGLPRNKSRQCQSRGPKSRTFGLQHLPPKPLGHAASVKRNIVDENVLLLVKYYCN